MQRHAAAAARAAPWLAGGVVVLIVFAGSCQACVCHRAAVLLRKARPSCDTFRVGGACHSGLLPSNPPPRRPASRVLAAITTPNNYGALLFSLHPIFMSAAFVCFMPLALTT
jgi:hypothetical protein